LASSSVRSQEPHASSNARSERPEERAREVLRDEERGGPEQRERRSREEHAKEYQHKDYQPEEPQHDYPLGKDGHSQEGELDLEPSFRSALRLISWRRSETLSQLHGNTTAHYFAWLAEWVTCAIFTVAHLVMLGLWARHDGNQDSYVTTLFVTAIAAATYFAKACHMADFVINGIVVPLPRYIDWIVTTPLMLYEVCHIAHASFGSTFMVICCDLLMIATGIIEAMIPWKPHKGIKQIWFLLSCWFFVLMLLVIHFDVAKKAEKQNEVAQSLFKQLEVLTVVVWSLYPFIVGIGRANAGLITKPVEDIALCVLDVVAKVGMEGMIVASCFQGCLGTDGDH
jgi:bacteriorhodopsin